MSVTVEIITPKGIALAEDGFRQVVLRRRESRIERGSEICVLPKHGRMLVRLPIHVMRLERGDEVRCVEIDGGFAEVRDDVVSVLTSGAREISPGTRELPR